MIRTLSLLLGTPIGCLWLLNCAIGVVALAILAKRKLAKEYAGVAIYLAGSVAVWGWLFWSMDSAYGYRDAWRRAQWLVIALWLIVAIDMAAVMVRQIKMERSYGFAALGVTSAGAVVAAALLWGRVALPWTNSVAQHIAWAWCAAFVACLGLVGFWVHARSFGIKFGTNVRRLVPLVCALLAVKAIHFAWLGRATENVMAAQYLLVGGEAAFRGLLIWGLRRGGEDYAPPPPRPRLLDAIERAEDELLSGLKRRA